MSGFTQALLVVATSAVLSSLLLTFSAEQGVTSAIPSQITVQSANVIDAKIDRPVVYTNLPTAQLLLDTSSEPSEEKLIPEPVAIEPKIKKEETPEVTPPKVKVKSQSQTEVITPPTPTPEPEIKKLELQQKTVRMIKPEVVSETKTTPATSADTALGKLIHKLTNDARVDDDLSTFSYDSALAELATARSEDMIKQDYFSHDAPGGCDLACRFEKSGYKTLSWGENIAEIEGFAGNDKAIAEQFITNWLDSRGHRDNMLSKKFTHQGIGVARKNGRVVVTVIFTRQ